MSDSPTHNDSMARRDFLRRTVCASTGAVLAGAGAAFLYQKHPSLITATTAEGPKDFVLRKFNVVRPAGALQMAIAHGSDEPTKLLLPALQKLGGMAAFITKGDVVVIKPNVAFATPALTGATSNPDLVAALVKEVISAGASRVIVTDNPINTPDRAFFQTGIGPAAQKEGAEVMIPREQSFVPLSVEGGQLIRQWPFYAEPFLKADKVIGVAPVKDHTRAKASMSMKNWYGLLGGRRNQFHQDVHNIVKELAMMMTPTLVVLDGTRVMMRNGPTGGSMNDLAGKQTLIISTDQVAADAAGYELLERDPAQLDYLQMAADLGLGNRRYKEIPYEEFNL